MNYWIIAGAVLFIILVSIQYSLNKIVVLLKQILDVLRRIDVKEKTKG